MKTVLLLALFFFTNGLIAQTSDTLVYSDHCTYCKCYFCGYSEAQFPGGSPAFRKYIAANIQYPAGTSFTGVEKCFLNFTIDTDGSITDIVVIRGVTDCPECDAEAIRVLKNSPKWQPAMNRFEPYRSEIHLPIVFDIN